MPEAARAVAEAEAFFGNPGSIHREGVAAAKLLLDSREKIARELGCKARDIVFTSGGTEANNLAIIGSARAIAARRNLAEHQRGFASLANASLANSLSLQGTHWIVSAIEHPSVLECFGEIERLGGRVDFVEPDSKGMIQPEVLARMLRRETVFVSIGWANSEIGIVQSLAKIARELHAYETANKTTIIFHSDAGQAPLYDAARVHSLGVDILTLDSAKLYGPRGIGCLYLSDRVELAPMILGGKQERGLRAGTENVALAAGFARAFKIIAAERAPESKRLEKLRHYLAKEIRTRIPGVILNGDKDASMPHILNISIPDISSEYVTLALDHSGIAVSTKSACREGEKQRSHVVEALGGDEWHAKNTLRFSLGRDTREKDLKQTIDALAESVQLSQKHR